ncbi:ATP-binding protein [Acidiferrimicrobium sp. IK]|uniref:ATP-binding protein n=1 Tax=Acidiferrimicrobium sp. IK TaxID=2871700 RepID=UPI0021CB3A1F|nr:ATP-binding protein [Acidiferrimicrobium sp. IK]
MAGRDRDLEEFSSLIEILASGGADRSRIFYGLRGVGKTVLLMELDLLASEAGWATTDVQEVGSQPDFRSTFAQMAARLLREMSRRHRIRDRVERALGVVKAFSVVAPGGVQLKLDVDAVAGVADSGDPEQDLVELLREIGHTAASVQSGALFLIDEMHNLDAASLAAVCMAFQAVSRDALPVALAAAGLPDLQVRLMRAKPYADRLFEYRELGRLRDPEARVALVKPASLLGVEFAADAADEVVRLAAGYPYFLQEYGRELWNAAESSPIITADVEEVRDLVQEQLARTFYGTRFEMASDAEQRYLAAMASLGGPPYATAEVARAWGAENQRQTSPHRDSLIQKGLIWAPRRGQVDFTVPLFAEFLLEHHPIGGFDGELPPRALGPEPRLESRIDP